MNKKFSKRISLSYNKIIDELKILILIFISYFYLLSPTNKEIWLFCERKDSARDNGFHFFKYMRKNHPEIKSYYIINKSEEGDYNKIKPLGNIIQYGSLKHMLYFIISKKLLFAHRLVVEPFEYNKLKKFQNFIPEKKFIFLRHGITKDDQKNELCKANPSAIINLLICGASLEYDYISENFGYLPNEVAYTGLARFDKLNNIETKNQILLMPTWRTGIIQPWWINEKIVEDEKFLNSIYYKKYQNLINSRRLVEFLETNNINLVFYPHYLVQQYLKYFKSKSDSIIIADKAIYDVQALLKESKLLITDFSSVFFDFAYMNKPVIYYQFDKDYFWQIHHKKGYFSYEEHGFGPVFETEAEVVDFINKSFENNFSFDEKYKKRADKFFPLKDSKNCERIYNAVINLKNQQFITDKLIKEIFENYDHKFTIQEFDIYRYNSYLMYKAKSKKYNYKIWLHIFPKDSDKLNNPNVKFNKLNFTFEDLSVTNNESKYKNEKIAIVKLPDIKIRKIDTGLIEDLKKDEDIFFKRSISKLYPIYILYNEKFNLKRAFLNINAYNAIKKNCLLDIRYYFKNSNDVESSGMDPILHYMYHGFKEGRNPNPTFDNDYYLNNYNDVKNSNLNPLVHYSLYGIKEGRKINNKEKILKNELNTLHNKGQTLKNELNTLQNRFNGEKTKCEDIESKLKELKEEYYKYSSVPTYENLKLALKGKDGYLFLINDSNNEIRQHFDYAYVNNFNAPLFIKNLNYKKDYCRNNNIEYFFFLTPDKSLICKDFLPFDVKLIKRNYDLIKEYIPDFAHSLDQTNYFKCESHLNYYAGKELSYQYLNYIDKGFKREDLAKLMDEQISYVNYEHYGDLLADKNWSYLKEEKEEYLHEKAVRFENKCIVDLSENLPQDFKTVRLRKTEYYKNDHSFTDLRVLIFRDSTTNYLKDVLSVYFKEILLYWDHWFFNEELIKWYKPDIILEIRTERFLENMKYEIK